MGPIPDRNDHSGGVVPDQTDEFHDIAHSHLLHLATAMDLHRLLDRRPRADRMPRRASSGSRRRPLSSGRWTGCRRVDDEVTLGRSVSASCTGSDEKCQPTDDPQAEPKLDHSECAHRVHAGGNDAILSCHPAMSAACQASGDRAKTGNDHAPVGPWSNWPPASFDGKLSVPCHPAHGDGSRRLRRSSLTFERSLACGRRAA